MDHVSHAKRTLMMGAIVGTALGATLASAATPKQYTLTIKQPLNGSISKDSTKATVPAGTVVTLTATPAANYVFSAWTDACKGSTGTCKVTMNSDLTVGAAFVAKPVPPTPRYSLAINPAGGGADSKVTVSPAGANFAKGQLVTLTATTGRGYVFGGWRGACMGVDSTCKITMNQDQSVYADFKLAPPDLNLPAADSNGNLMTRFDWGKVTGVTAYQLLVSESDKFEGFDASKNTCNDTCGATVQPSTSAYVFFQEARDYWWKVRTVTGTGAKAVYGDWSIVRKYSTGTPTLRKIADTARALNSPYQSAVAVKLADGTIAKGWETDMGPVKDAPDRDGIRFRSAFAVLHQWVTKKTTEGGAGGFDNWANKQTRKTPETLRNKICAPLLTTNGYQQIQCNQLTDQIIAKYSGSVPADDDATLMTLQIFSQCKETADRLVIDGGGKRVSYTSSGVATDDILPGYYGMRGTSHSGIVTAVRWDDKNGTNKDGNKKWAITWDGFTKAAKPVITHALITESNAEGPWVNPAGQVPWSRTIRRIWQKVDYFPTYVAPGAP